MAVPLALVVEPLADRMPQLVALRLEVVAVLVVRLDLDRLLRHDLEPESADPGDFFGLLVSTLIVVRPRSARICEPIPYSGRRP